MAFLCQVNIQCIGNCDGRKKRRICHEQLDKRFDFTHYAGYLRITGTVVVNDWNEVVYTNYKVIQEHRKHKLEGVCP